MNTRRLTREAIPVCRGQYASRLGLWIGVCLAGWAATADAQVTKLVPLGPPQDEPARVTPELRSVDDTAWAERPRAAQTVQRISYEPAQAPIRVSSSDVYEVRRAAYQPTTPADVAPSLAPNGTSPPMSPWTGTTSSPSSIPATSYPSYSASPWTSSSGVPVTSGGVIPAAPVPSSMYSHRYAVPLASPCATPVVGVAGSVPVTRGGFPPLLPIASSTRPVFVSSGLLGQPVIYTPGQPIRNFFRYFTL
jgi:hypothetical protein